MGQRFTSGNRELEVTSDDLAFSAVRTAQPHRPNMRTGG